MSSVVVTGGGRGIGAATAQRAAAAGYDVVVNYRKDHEAAEAVVAACAEKAAQGQPGRAVAVQGDVTDPSAISAMFDAAESMSPLHGLVNNAGILDSQARLTEMSAERIRRVVDVNVVGALLCAAEAVRRLEAANHPGSIVNISSVASRLGSGNEFIDYAATKGAVDTMTLGLATEVGPQGIRVNAVRPGLIFTEMHADGGEPGRVDRLAPMIPMRRGGSADEVAAMVVWLMSDEASYVSGALLDVSGGR